MATSMVAIATTTATALFQICFNSFVAKLFLIFASLLVITCQLRAISNDHYPQLDLSFLNNDKDDQIVSLISFYFLLYHSFVLSFYYFVTPALLSIAFLLSPYTIKLCIFNTFSFLPFFILF
ncbi:hypothetical protein CISIN_1g033362mg [Citrus sinensis]|uniref:Uncharacterized protein n=1 Tax=Citrus sinensis TaxID=2711 RepID=A0A067E8H3_CITSI|nr:hypothetical protein CISIN_1g033362mg [Citrus sinensis]